MEQTSRRRRFLRTLTGGLVSVFGLRGRWNTSAAAEQRRAEEVTAADLQAAGRVAGFVFSDAELNRLLPGVAENHETIQTLRAFEIGNEIGPAIRFDPLLFPSFLPSRSEEPRWSRETLPALPHDRESLAFWPVRWLSELVRTRRISSMELARLYLHRLKRFDPVLRCVVSLTEESALRAAAEADRELAAGKYRGLLHGIPFGIKDVFATREYPTTWGAPMYAQRVMGFDAAVVERLREAGAVMIAKLSLGPLARGDVWWRGMTRNPWNTAVGSGGSSAGSAAAAAAGLVGFAIGSSTLDSIIGPAARCGVTGLRPTFGRISRYGAMTLTWSLDKVGPICRSAEDCAAVFHAIHGPDGRDASLAAAAPFNWDAQSRSPMLRIGYVKSAFESNDGDSARHAQDRAALEVVRSLYPQMSEIELPETPEAALLILHAEAAAAFDEIVQRHDSDELKSLIGEAWPLPLRQALLIPAVDYIRANRIRAILIQKMAEIMASVDVYVVPTTGTHNSFITNLTGQPCVTVPIGMSDGLPIGLSFVGRPFDDANALRVAHAFQSTTQHHRLHPPNFGV